ncbi:MAG: hypothetical protein V7K15_23350 [Nostoc sp.]
MSPTPQEIVEYFFIWKFLSANDAHAATPPKSSALAKLTVRVASRREGIALLPIPVNAIILRKSVFLDTFFRKLVEKLKISKTNKYRRRWTLCDIAQK